MFKLFDEFYSEINIILNKKRKETKKKEIILYGYNESGKFLNYILEYHLKEKVAYIVDKYRYTRDEVVENIIPLKKVHNLNLFDNINNENYYILSTITNFQELKDVTTNYGYVENINLFDIRKIYFKLVDNEYEFKKRPISYLNFLEYKYKLDLVKMVTTQESGYTNQDFNYTSASYDITLDFLLRKLNIDQNDSILDLGSGKGAAIIIMSEHKFKNISGVELSDIVYNIAKKNLEKLLIENVNIIHSNATELLCIDNYNYFYLFNSFTGKTLEHFISNLKESYQTNKRLIKILCVGNVDVKCLDDAGLKLIDEFYIPSIYVKIKVHIYSII